MAFFRTSFTTFPFFGLMQLVQRSQEEFQTQKLCTSLKIYGMIYLDHSQCISSWIKQEKERIIKGYSQIRNEALAYAFSYMNLIEHWGSGIPRIIGKVKAMGLREPEFIGGEVDLRINIYRNPINGYDMENGVNVIDDVETTAEVPESAGKVPESAGEYRKSAGKVPENDQENQIYNFVRDHGFITRVQVMELLKIKERRARNILRKMVEEEWLRKEGASRNIIYVINQDKRLEG